MTDMRALPGVAPEAPPQERGRACPYVGLVPYAEDDAPFFFGRERERDIIVANLLASRLTLLYGASGVGKSSVLRAGVLPDLRREAGLDRIDLDHESTVVDLTDAGRPEFLPVMFSEWSSEPVGALGRCIRSAVAQLPDPPSVDLPATASLIDVLRAWTEATGADLLLILDQFEEYFLYHGDEQGPGTFAAEFPRAVRTPDLPVNFLVSIREDALAKLDRFKGDLPNLFDNYLRVDHLGRVAARTAILGPVERFNAVSPGLPPVEVEPSLVGAVLDQVEAGRLVVGEADGAVDHRSDEGDRPIEAPHLQLVLTRLWSEEARAGSRVLRRETLDRLGGAERIVRTHLDQAMTSLDSTGRDIAADVFHHLVTPSGTKIAHTVSDLAVYAGVPEPALEAVLERLSAWDLRIIRPVAPPPDRPGATRYEIFHDVLAAAVLDWRRRYAQERTRREAEERLDEERRKAEQRARRERRKALVASTVAVVMVALVVGAGWAAIHARRERARAESLGLVAAAMAAVDTDPGEGVKQALEAIRVWDSPESEEALRRAMSNVNVRTVLSGHTNWLWAASLDPDATTVLTGSWDGTARLWDAATGQERLVLEGDDPLVSAEFSQDGTMALTAGAGGTATVWDTATGSTLATLPGGGEYLATASFAADDSRAVTAGVGVEDAQGIARVWDARTGEELAELTGHGAGIAAARFDATGRFVVTAAADGTARVWDAETGDELAVLAHENDRVNAASFSPDGDLVVTGANGGEALMWRWREGDDPLRLPGHAHDVSVVEFSRDGRHIITADGKQAQVWEADTGNRVVELRGHTDWLLAASFSPDARRVVTASQDGTARLWDAATGRALAAFRGHRDAVVRASFSADGHTVVTASTDGTARVWSADEGRALAGFEDWAGSARFSPGGEHVLAASIDGTARVWGVDSGREEAVLGGDEAIRSAAFSNDGRFVVAGGDHGRVRVWDWREGHEPIADLRAPDDTVAVYGVAFSPTDEDLVATAGEDWLVHLWDWRAGEERAAFHGHENWVTGVSFSPDGERVISSSLDKTARVWDAETGAELRRLEGHTGFVYSARFSDDGETIVTASGDGTARLWEASTGKMLQLFRGHDGAVLAAGLNADGTRVVTGGADGMTGVWDAGTGRSVALFRRHADSVKSVEFAAGGDLVLSAGDDHAVRLYPCPTCGPKDGLVRDAEELLARLPEPAPARSLLADEAAVAASTLGLDVGDCYDDLAIDAPGTPVTLRDCAGPHDNEVFALIEHPADDATPFRTDEVADYAFEQCSGDAFESYVGEHYRDSRYFVGYLTPTEESWQAGDRLIACHLYLLDDQSVGSARGAEA